MTPAFEFEVSWCLFFRQDKHKKQTKQEKREKQENPALSCTGFTLLMINPGFDSVSKGSLEKDPALYVLRGRWALCKFKLTHKNRFTCKLSNSPIVLTERNSFIVNFYQPDVLPGRKKDGVSLLQARLVGRNQ